VTKTIHMISFVCPTPMSSVWRSWVTTSFPNFAQN